MVRQHFPLCLVSLNDVVEKVVTSVFCYLEEAPALHSHGTVVRQRNSVRGRNNRQGERKRAELTEEEGKLALTSDQRGW